MRLMLCLAVVSLAIAADRPDLNGTWKASDASQTIAIHQKNGAVQFDESGKENLEFECNTVGQACKIKGGEVSLWYNGATLVLMETLHGNSRVTKIRLKVSDDGKNLDEEIVHIAPAGDTEKLHLARQSQS